LDPDQAHHGLKGFYETYYNYGGNQKGFYVKLRKIFLDSIFYRIWMAVDGDICFHAKRGTGRLLDIGCNEGRGLQNYIKNGFFAEGLELNEKASSEARKKGFIVYSQTLGKFYPKSLYDVIVLSHVLEHLNDPQGMLTHAARLLKTGGEIWISCPNIKSWQRRLFGKYWINWHAPFHICFFSTSTMKSFLNKCGFEILKIKHTTPSLWIAQSVIAALFAKSGQINCAQRHTILLGSLIILARFAFFPILWIGNLFKQGDCITIVGRKIKINT
jgi:2-polyprenyl-3-methyl-5-hydroxy-6-metoxy-1,4-benzoquinol methylase